MNNTFMEKYLQEYMEKLTKTVIGFKLSRNTESEKYLGEVANSIRNGNETLLKKQIDLLSLEGMKHIQIKNNTIMIDYKALFLESMNANFNVRSNFDEKNLVQAVFPLMNLSDALDNETCIKLNKNEAEKFLRINVEIMEKQIKDEIIKSDIEELLYSIYMIADRLSLISEIVYTKVKMKGELRKTDYSASPETPPFTLLVQSINEMNTEELINTSFIIGEQKYFCDVLFNIIYEIYRQNSYNNLNETKIKADISSLFSKISIMCKMDIYMKSNALLYEQGETLEIKDFNILQSGDLSQKLEKLMIELSEFNYDERLTSKIQEKYKEVEGFNASDLITLIEFLSSQNIAKKAQIKIESYPIDKFKEGIAKVCGLNKSAIDKFIHSLTIECSSRKFMDAKNKISIKPIVPIANDRIMLSIPLLMQAYLRFGARMLQQNFTDNARLKTYISKNYDEALISELIDELNRHNVKNWNHVQLNSINDKTIKSMFNVKGVTNEMDIAYLSKNILYFVEYKTWMISSFSISSMLNEFKKAEKHVKSHQNAIKIVNENREAFSIIFGNELLSITEIKLVMVFQNPNAFNHLNKSNNVIGVSFKDFKDSIKQL